MKKTRNELTRMATIIALRNGIVKASQLLVKAKSQDESRMLVTFIEQSAHHIEKLKNQTGAGSFSVKLGSLVNNRKVVRAMSEKAGISTIQELIASPQSIFFSILIRQGPDRKDPLIQEKKEGIIKSLHEVFSAMQPGVISKGNNTAKGVKRNDKKEPPPSESGAVRSPR